MAASRTLAEIQEERIFKENYGTGAQLLLMYKIFNVIFHIHNDINAFNQKHNKQIKNKKIQYIIADKPIQYNMLLTQIIMALYYQQKINPDQQLTQKNIADMYGLPVSSVATVIAKHLKQRTVKGTIIKNPPENVLIYSRPDKKYKNRKILRLTKLGKSNAQAMLGFMHNMLNNMKTNRKKTENSMYHYLAPIEKTLTDLYTSTKSPLTLNNNKIKKSPTRKGAK